MSEHWTPGETRLLLDWLDIVDDMEAVIQEILDFELEEIERIIEEVIAERET